MCTSVLLQMVKMALEKSGPEQACSEQYWLSQVTNTCSIKYFVVNL